ncbi:MAG TPA: cyclase family protein [Ktedonobacterales bacterium]|nr:cyclase family protein [Ktedonobacterales bacterium]
MADSWIDVSVPLHDGMVHWPDNPPVSIERALSMDRGDLCNVSKMSLGVHTGTHMDAPVHWIPGGKGIDEMPLDAVIGPARVIAIQDSVSIKPDELKAYNIQRGERVLFKTRNSGRCWSSDAFVEDFVFVAHEAARYLAALGARTIGVDYLSVGGYKLDGAETHRALLDAGIWIIEGLNLSPVAPGMYDLICLPLRLAGADGAPARALLRPL